MERSAAWNAIQRRYNADVKGVSTFFHEAGSGSQEETVRGWFDTLRRADSVDAARMRATLLRDEKRLADFHMLTLIDFFAISAECARAVAEAPSTPATTSTTR